MEHLREEQIVLPSRVKLNILKRQKPGIKIKQTYAKERGLCENSATIGGNQLATGIAGMQTTNRQKLVNQKLGCILEGQLSICK